MNSDYAVFIGRFEPFHKGHEAVLKKALSNAKHVVVLVGSAHRSRSPKNPFTWQEREQMVRACLSDAENTRVTIRPIRDYLYIENRWLTVAHQLVHQVIRDRGEDPKDVSIRLTGRNKDRTSYYLEQFPKWMPMIEVHQTDTLSATELRRHFFLGTDGSMRLLKANLPEGVYDMLMAFKEHASAYEPLKAEFEQQVSDQKAWKEAKTPHEVIFTTVDAVVFCQGHVLLHKRHQTPGKGLWALPGGFLGVHERLREASLRYLEDKTNIKVLRHELVGSEFASDVFDHVDRSEWGRRVTHAFAYALKGPELPKVRDSRAQWVPLAEIEELSEHMFEDHKDIVERFMGMLKETPR